MMKTDKIAVTIKKHEVICREGDSSNSLFYVLSGKLLICSRSGTMVTPLAYIGAKDFFGEMAFFDNKDRSADVIALKDTVLYEIPYEEAQQEMPKWLQRIGIEMSTKLRALDRVISSRGIRRKNLTKVEPLSIDDQRKLFNILKTD